MGGQVGRHVAEQHHAGRLARNRAPELSPSGNKTVQKTVAAQTAKSLVISASDDAILRSVYHYHFLTALEICRLFYDPDSLKFVRGKLKRLSETGYLHRLLLPTVGLGKPAFVYTLARKGINYLKAAGFDEFERFHPSEQEHAFLFMRHTLAVNDFIIAAECLRDEEPGMVLADFAHERNLKKTPVTVTTYQNEKVGVIPDAWLDFHLRGKLRVSIVLELDRGTVQQKAFMRKLRGLLAYSQGPYQEFWNSDALTIAFATTAGARRCEQMRRWCEAMLKEAHHEDEADIFLFTALNENEVWSPQTLFLSLIWRQPFTKSPIALLGVEK